MKKTNVLVTSVGGLTGVFITKHLKSVKEQVKIVGVDMSDMNAAKKWLDNFYQVPPSNDPKYLERISEIVENEKIDVIIPVSSYDMNVFTEPEAKTKRLDKKMLIMDREMHRKLHNKERCYHFLASIGICTPEVLTDEITFPLIMKPKEGTGSKGIKIIETAEDLAYWKKKISEYLLMEYLEGKEYTVDCLFRDDGTCIGWNVRERMKMNGGGAVISKNSDLYNKKIEKVIEKLEITKKIKGPVNFQFKEKNGEICVFDFNTRLASGGLALTVASGFDIPSLIIDLVERNTISNWKIDEKNKNLIMIRYYEEVFINGQ